MNIDQFGNVYRNSREIIDLLYDNPEIDFSNVNITDKDELEKFINSVRACDTNTKLPNQFISDKTDLNRQSNWFIPEEYQTLDIEALLLGLCQTDLELQRVQEELELFKQHNFLPVLKTLKYLIDTFRKNNVLWGVGRGSSVASYCLFLLGVHKINSIQYQLDIKEFIK